MLKYPSPDPALYKSLLESYFRCLKNKRHVQKKTFHLDYERTVHGLALDIQNRAYRPGLSNIFVVTHPRPREVIAANLRDRIVHHFIYDYMAPWWEKRFVPNSYACRVGKGPLQAGRDLRKFIDAHYRGGGRPLYYLQLDIQNFFPSIDQNVLYRLIDKHLENPLFLWLCRTVIFHRATDKGNFKLTSPATLWKTLPKYKSLFRAPAHLGLPIGNLTSQFFANVYMNKLDQYIAHHLKGRSLYWQRYVDDILFLGEDQEALRTVGPLVQEFLQRELHLTLNPKKTLLQPLAHGLDHLGFWHKPHYQLVRRRIANTCKAKIGRYARQAPETVVADDVCSTVNSYMGHFRHANSQRLREHVGRMIASTEALAGKLALDPSATKFVAVKDPKPEAQRAEREKRLLEEFQTGLAVTMETGDARDARRATEYVKRWQSLDDILEAAGDHFRESPASHADLPPDFRPRRRRATLREQRTH